MKKNNRIEGLVEQLHELKLPVCGVQAFNGIGLERFDGTCTTIW